MILAAIIGAGAVFGIFWSIKTKNIFSAIIVVGMIIGIVIALDPTKVMQSTGFYIYMSFAGLGFVYGLVAKELKASSRIVVCLMTAAIIVYWLWVINHWHGNVLVVPILVLATVIVAFIRKINLKNELGFLAILTMDAVAILTEHIIKAN